MLEYWKNGERIELNAIYGKGIVGQTVILGERVCWDGIDPDEKQLSKYPYLSVFTIIDKKDGKDGYYLLKDSQNCAVILKDKHYGASCAYLYDLNEWLQFNEKKQEEKLSRKQRKIEQLEGHVNLLKDILVKQGIRIVTENEGKELGIVER